MQDLVRELIQKRLKELDLKESRVSIDIGRAASYLQQYLKRGIPRELKESDRLKLGEILGINPDQLRGPSSPVPARTYAKTSNNNHHPALPGRPSVKGSAAMSDIGHNSLDRIRPLPNTGRDLPVFGTAQGGDGALIITDRPVDWEVRPDFLARVEDAYGIIVTGDSMDPECKHGSTAIVNPHLPQRNGDTCIFRAHADDGAVHAIVKQLVRYNDKTWYVHQHNPKKDFELKRSEWQVCHVVVGNYNRR